VQIINYSYLY